MMRASSPSMSRPATSGGQVDRHVDVCEVENGADTRCPPPTTSPVRASRYCTRPLLGDTSTSVRQNCLISFDVSLGSLIKPQPPRAPFPLPQIAACAVRTPASGAVYLPAVSSIPSQSAFVHVHSPCWRNPLRFFGCATVATAAAKSCFDFNNCCLCIAQLGFRFRRRDRRNDLSSGTPCRPRQRSPPRGDRVFCRYVHFCGFKSAIGFEDTLGHVVATQAIDQRLHGCTGFFERVLLIRWACALTIKSAPFETPPSTDVTTNRTTQIRAAPTALTWGTGSRPADAVVPSAVVGPVAKSGCFACSLRSCMVDAMLANCAKLRMASLRECGFCATSLMLFLTLKWRQKRGNHFSTASIAS